MASDDSHQTSSKRQRFAHDVDIRLPDVPLDPLPSASNPSSCPSSSSPATDSHSQGIFGAAANNAAPPPLDGQALAEGSHAAAARRIWHSAPHPRTSSAFDVALGRAVSGMPRVGLLGAGTGAGVMGAMRQRRRMLDEVVSVNGFPHCQLLTGHKSCVNALAWSRGDSQGRWLASGGDDMRVHIRDLCLDLDESARRPVVQLLGHKSNIFSLAWSCDNRHIFSGGNDDRVLFHDFTHSPLPIRTASNPPCRTSAFDSIASHEDSIREVSAHPHNPSLALSCSDDGVLQLLDVRAASHAGRAGGGGDMVVGSRLARASFAAVQWNPNPGDGNTFVAATMGTDRGEMMLLDARTAFKSTGSPLGPKEALVRYWLGLGGRRPARGARGATRVCEQTAELTSVSFDPEGKLLATNVSLYQPTIYAVGDPRPLATCSASPELFLPSFDVSLDGRTTVRRRYGGVGAVAAEAAPTSKGGRTATADADSLEAPMGYRNSCTVKHGSFAQWGGGETYYVAGSDSFQAFGWRVPDVEQLAQTRERSSWQRFVAQPPQTHTGGDNETFYFDRPAFGSTPGRPSSRQWPGQSGADGVGEDREIVWPVDLSTPSFTLEGAQSVANVACAHPCEPRVAVAGVERVVRLYSAVPLPSRSACVSWSPFPPTCGELSGVARAASRRGAAGGAVERFGDVASAKSGKEVASTSTSRTGSSARRAGASRGGGQGEGTADRPAHALRPQREPEATRIRTRQRLRIRNPAAIARDLARSAPWERRSAGDSAGVGGVSASAPRDAARADSSSPPHEATTTADSEATTPAVASNASGAPRASDVRPFAPTSWVGDVYYSDEQDGDDDDDDDDGEWTYRFWSESDEVEGAEEEGRRGRDGGARSPARAGRGARGGEARAEVSQRARRRWRPGGREHGYDDHDEDEDTDNDTDDGGDWDGGRGDGGGGGDAWLMEAMREAKTLAMFDELLRQEEGRRLFDGGRGPGVYGGGMFDSEEEESDDAEWESDEAEEEEARDGGEDVQMGTGAG